ncbi:L-threonylcarbamoyladenylate synthase [Acetobacterium woodii]|uniref:L-threonylcarbamoyladenylate synthase n=1 Tax=Acetobacterium woodii (strain ATCC 29683 / DSM 1030 / JCM 2381 / KCTC 1655 / WB1) TaxID=931626 RepID=H6LKY2_ACEWD|nr:L-threonylcarbamoyladenylate synthase [Acetobacterium woodii]AFA50091.1 putative Sua5/YciO/YrdC/YwlC family protein [Acetobacterium woodii DSM 1030]
MDKKNTVCETTPQKPTYQILTAGQDAYEKAAQAIRDGKIVVMPTLTIYVLVCDAFNAAALKRLREIRHSPADKPITIVMDKSKIPEYAVLNERQTKIIDIFSPSPVSLYVQKKDKTPLDAATAASDAIVVYFQDSPIRDLYECFGSILAISSSNTKALLAAKTIEESIAYFGETVDLYIDGGPAQGDNASPHIDIRTNPVESRRAANHFPFEKIKAILAENGLA